MGGQGSADLANPIKASLQHNHPRAGEFFLRHRNRELGAEQHQVEGIAGWRRRRNRPRLGGEGGVRLGYRPASPGARPAGARASPARARDRSGERRSLADSTSALAAGERGNGHRH